MNEKRTGLWSRQIEYYSQALLWHRYPVAVIQVMAFRLIHPPSIIGDLNRFWLSYLSPLIFCSQNLAFQYFDFEHTWWWLFQKHVTQSNMFELRLFINSSNSFSMFCNYLAWIWNKINNIRLFWPIWNIHDNT
jgi:hypothetical protein